MNFMSKKRVVIIIAGVLTVVIASYFFFKPSPKKPTEIQEQEFALSKKTKTFIDPSGFKFSYPENLLLETKENKNENDYSSLEILSEDIEGNSAITVTETDITTVDQWLKLSNVKVNKKSRQKVKLGDLNAERIEANNKLYAVAIDQGILFLIVTDLTEEKKHWVLIHDQIVKTFAFSPPEAQPATDSSGDGGVDEEVIFEGEEVIE